MSSPTFITTPREIRDRVYEFDPDLGQMVIEVRTTFNAKDQSFRQPSCRHSVGFAPCNCYGKRKFYFGDNEPIPFLESNAIRRHLIKNVEVLENPIF